MKKICRVCGQGSSSHHDFEATMPDGCVCLPGEWDEDVPPACNQYAGLEGSNCENCEHDRGCHKGTQEEG